MEDDDDPQTHNRRVPIDYQDDSEADTGANDPTSHEDEHAEGDLCPSASPENLNSETAESGTQEDVDTQDAGIKGSLSVHQKDSGHNDDDVQMEDDEADFAPEPLNHNENDYERVSGAVSEQARATASRTGRPTRQSTEPQTNHGRNASGDSHHGSEVQATTQSMPQSSQYQKEPGLVAGQTVPRIESGGSPFQPLWGLNLGDDFHQLLSRIPLAASNMAPIRPDVAETMRKNQEQIVRQSLHADEAISARQQLEKQHSRTDKRNQKGKEVPQSSFGKKRKPDSEPEQSPMKKKSTRSNKIGVSQSHTTREDSDRAEASATEQDSDAIEVVDSGSDVDQTAEGEEESLFVPQEAITPEAQPKRRKRGRPQKNATIGDETIPAAKKRLSRAEKQALQNRQRELNITNMSSIFGSNVIESARSNEARDEQPIATATNRQQALRQLIASIPEEHRANANLDRKQLHEALKNFSRQCKPDGASAWRLTDLSVSLSHYQMLGVSVMRQIELRKGMCKGLDLPTGGIVADEMGLGKTATAIANIFDSLKDEENPEGRITTLIVVPTSLTRQWVQELSKFVRPEKLGPVGRLYAGSRSFETRAELLNFKVVVTTYGEVKRSFPSTDPPPSCTTQQQVAEWWRKHFENNKGLLHSVKFKRIILDEAQAIKNHLSATSRACCHLEADFYWCLSGTPVMNTLAEFYPYFKFIGVKHTGSFKTFKHNYITEDDPTGASRLSVMLRRIMIRRTHKDKLLSSKLLVLPKPTQTNIPVSFSPFERAIYDVVRKRIIERINGFSREELKCKHNHILSMLLRLRQMTGHILLVQDAMIDILQAEDFEELRRIASQTLPLHSTEAAQIVHLRFMLQNSAHLARLEPAKDENVQPTTDLTDGAGTGATDNGSATDTELASGVKEVIDLTTTETTVRPARPSCTRQVSHQDLGSMFGLKNNNLDYVNDLEETWVAESVSRKATVCNFCQKDARQSHLLRPCKHVLCNDCWLQVAFQFAHNGANESKCPICGGSYTTAYAHNETLYTDRWTGFKSASASVAPGAKSFAGLDGDKMPRTKRLNTVQTIEKWLDGNGKMIPSAKTLAVKAQLLEWMSEEPRPKVIIYTQFLTMLRILKQMCGLEGWTTGELHGGLSAERRQDHITKFMGPEGPDILIATLACGGVGLNLTAASKVILIDLWWNSAAEQQAFCRTYRRGQNKPTFLSRFIVRNSIDEQMARMQERKDREIQSVMGESARNRRLTTEELVSLFASSDESKPFIFANSAREDRRGASFMRDA